MKLFKFNYLIIILLVLFSACIDEPLTPASEQEIISEISGTWNGDLTEDGEFSVTGFSSLISAKTDGQNEITITNFHKSGETVTGVVFKDLSIEIPSQTIGEQIFEGTGEISNDYNTITWNYTIVNSDYTVHVTGTFSFGSSV
jgi:hypothetical protein